MTDHDIPPLCLCFARVLELAQVLNVRDIKNLPGAWIYYIDDSWTIAMNGHNAPVEVSFENSSHMTVQLPPFEMSVWYNGFIAGLIGPFEGIIAAGSGANEDTFLAAIDAHIAQLKVTAP